MHQEAAAEQAVPAETAPAAEDVAAPVPGVKDPVTVTTDLQKVTFDREGGVIVGTELIHVPNLSDWKDIGLAGLILGCRPTAAAPTPRRRAWPVATSPTTRTVLNSSARSLTWVRTTTLRWSSAPKRTVSS